LLRKILIGLGVVLLIVATGVGVLSYKLNKTGGTNPDYQHDADIVRLNDLATLASMIEKFHDKTGRYPLEGKVDVPNYVNIATPNQSRSITGSPPYDHKVTHVNEFWDELSGVLGEEMEVVSDPQRFPVNKPIHYIYMIKDATYYAAVHLQNAFPFARKIGEYYYKLEVSNSPNSEQKIWTYRELMENADFKAAAGEKMLKPGYFENLRKKKAVNVTREMRR
jgi:hypothetical protein